jgi:catechol 2,3-dioxygenase-like lactoylglutathione lyase family enzyme
MIKVTDLAYGRLAAPDLDLMEDFLTSFGMVRAARTDKALFMRGHDPDHTIHVTELGDPAFLGLAFHAASEQDLEIIAKADGASAIHELDEPGAAKRVTITDPNGFQIEIIHGMEQLEPLDVRKITYNNGFERYNRTGDLQRVEMRPSHVKRSAHCVIKTPKVDESNAWYQKHFGLVTTDRVYAGEEDNTLAIFNHINSDDEFVDHHVFLCVAGEAPGFNHLSFEVFDFDDVQTGHEFLKTEGKYKHVWGVGRHYLGSQIFDYWRDPWGRIHEHWTDSDMINNSHKASVVPAEKGLSNQWGPEFPPAFLDDPEQHTL